MKSTVTIEGEQRKCLVETQMTDDHLRDLGRKIKEMSLLIDYDVTVPVGDQKFRAGYKRACTDILALLKGVARDNEELNFRQIK